MLEARRVAGGDINEAWELRLAGGERAFAKTHEAPPAGMFACEARGIAWLAEAGALRVPRVLACAEHLLVLEWIEPAARRADFDLELGRGLAALHRAAPRGFGFSEDGYIGTLPQQNGPCETWAEFYARRRLLPLLRRARDAGLAPPALTRRLEALAGKLERRVGPAEPPARLHGDLWGGNLHVDAAGSPCLVDPAVYGGQREVDLAMMQLFGGFSERVFAAYDESWPLAPGWRERVPLYQLYPLLVHVNLFGSAYLPSLDSALRRCE